MKDAQIAVSKIQSHGRIGEAATLAKCWMHGIPAYSTSGLRANFAGSDVIVDTIDPTKKLLIQVKAGYAPRNGQIYMTQCTSEDDLKKDKFVADFVVFVNIDQKAGKSHQHDGSLSFEHLIFYVVPRSIANIVFRDAVNREYNRPLIKTGGKRKLTYVAIYVEYEMLKKYKNAWKTIITNPSISVAPHSATSSPPNI